MTFEDIRSSQKYDSLYDRKFWHRDIDPDHRTFAVLAGAHCYVVGGASLLDPDGNRSDLISAAREEMVELTFPGQCPPPPSIDQVTPALDMLAGDDSLSMTKRLRMSAPLAAADKIQETHSRQMEALQGEEGPTADFARHIADAEAYFGLAQRAADMTGIALDGDAHAPHEQARYEEVWVGLSNAGVRSSLRALEIMEPEAAYEKVGAHDQERFEFALSALGHQPLELGMGIHAGQHMIMYESSPPNEKRSEQIERDFARHKRQEQDEIRRQETEARQNETFSERVHRIEERRRLEREQRIAERQKQAAAEAAKRDQEQRRVEQQAQWADRQKRATAEPLQAIAKDDYARMQDTLPIKAQHFMNAPASVISQKTRGLTELVISRELKGSDRERTAKLIAFRKAALGDMDALAEAPTSARESALRDGLILDKENRQKMMLAHTAGKMVGEREATEVEARRARLMAISTLPSGEVSETILRANIGSFLTKAAEKVDVSKLSRDERINLNTANRTITGRALDQSSPEALAGAADTIGRHHVNTSERDRLTLKAVGRVAREDLPKLRTVNTRTAPEPTEI